MSNISKLVRKYKQLIYLERKLSHHIPFRHVVEEYPFSEVSGRETQQKELEKVRRALSSIPSQIESELVGQYRIELAALESQLAKAHGPERVEIMKQQAVVAYKLRASSVMAEVESLQQ